MYQKFTYTQQESYKLDHIAFVELGERKLSYDEYETLHEFYMNDFQKFANITATLANGFAAAQGAAALLGSESEDLQKQMCNQLGSFFRCHQSVNGLG